MPPFAVPQTQALSCPVAAVEGVAQVTVSGEIDSATIALLDEALRMADALADDMSLDLSGVEFIDSCGAKLLLETARRVGARGDHFTLDGVSDVVTRILYLIGVEDEFKSTAAQTEATRPGLYLIRSPTSSQ